MDETTSLDALIQAKKAANRDLDDVAAMEAVMADLVAAGSSGYEDIYDRQNAIADELRGYDPEGRFAGGAYVAANPLEHLTDMLGEGMAGKIEADAETEYGGKLGEEDTARKMIAELERRLDTRKRQAF